MLDDVNAPHASPFDAIRRVNEYDHEYWSARDLGKILGYETNYRNFQKALKGIWTFTTWLLKAS